MIKHVFLGASLAVLAACSGSTTRLDMSQVSSTLDLRAAVSSAMVRTVSLPTYAAAEELSFETPEGLIISDETVLWADDPARAVTLAVARTMGEILKADVGPDPWPFVGLPDVAIDVRVSRMVTNAAGVFELEGQYFIGGDGIDYPRSTTAFAIAKPLTGEGAAGIADAQARAIVALSEEIARKLSR